MMQLGCGVSTRVVTVAGSVLSWSIRSRERRHFLFRCVAW